MLNGKRDRLIHFRGGSCLGTLPLLFFAALCLATCGDGNLQPPPSFQYECSDVTEFRDNEVVCGKKELCVNGYGQEIREHLCICDILCICWVGVDQDVVMLILGGDMCKLDRDSREVRLLKHKEFLDDN